MGRGLGNVRWMSWREGSTDGVCVHVGKGDAHVRLGTDEGPKGSGVPGWVPAKNAEVSWAGVWSQAQAWWGDASSTGSHWEE